MENNNLDQEIIDLVIARLETIPSKVELSVGDKGSFTVSELIDRIKANDEIGKKIIEMQLSYLRALKDLPIDENVPANN